MYSCYVMRYTASYIKSIYARYASLTAHISLYSMRYSALYTRGIVGYVIEDTYNGYTSILALLLNFL